MKTIKKKTDAIELLHEDHQKVRDLFFQFKHSQDTKQKEKILKEILMELYVHTTVEEEIVYPACSKEAEDAEDLIKEAETEHHVAKYLMRELSELSSDDEHFEAKVLVLCELVGHHIKEEEKEMFKKLEESDIDLSKLGLAMINRKAELKTASLSMLKGTISAGKKNKVPKPLEKKRALKTAGRRKSA